jgi:hypothetical protein
MCVQVHIFATASGADARAPGVQFGRPPPTGAILPRTVHDPLGIQKSCQVIITVGERSPCRIWEASDHACHRAAIVRRASTESDVRHEVVPMAVDCIRMYVVPIRCDITSQDRGGVAVRKPPHVCGMRDPNTRLGCVGSNHGQGYIIIQTRH